jgi:hypothetical protein
MHLSYNSFLLGPNRAQAKEAIPIQTMVAAKLFKAEFPIPSSNTSEHRGLMIGKLVLF